MYLPALGEWVGTTFNVLVLTEKTEQVVVVILADERVVDDRVQRLDAVVPNGLTAASRTDRTRSADSTGSGSINLRLHQVRPIGLTLVIFLNHRPLLARHT